MQGLLAAVAHTGPVRVDDEIGCREAADGVAVAGKLQVDRFFLRIDDAQAPGSVGSRIIAKVHRNIIDGGGGAGLHDDGDSHPRDDRTQQRKQEPDAAVVQQIALGGYGRLAVVLLSAHCCSSSSLLFTQFSRRLPRAIQPSAALFSLAVSLGIISSTSRV